MTTSGASWKGCPGFALFLLLLLLLVSSTIGGVIDAQAKLWVQSSKPLDGHIQLESDVKLIVDRAVCFFESAGSILAFPMYTIQILYGVVILVFGKHIPHQILLITVMRATGWRRTRSAALQAFGYLQAARAAARAALPRLAEARAALADYKQDARRIGRIRAELEEAADDVAEGGLRGRLAGLEQALLRRRLAAEAEQLEDDIDILAAAVSSAYAVYEALDPTLLLTILQGIAFTVTAAATGLQSRGPGGGGGGLLSELVCLLCLTACTAEIASHVAAGLAYPISQRMLFSSFSKNFHDLSKPVQKMVRRTSRLLTYAAALAVMLAARVSDHSAGFRLNALALGAYLVAQGAHKILDHAVEGRIRRAARAAAQERREEGPSWRGKEERQRQRPLLCRGPWWRRGEEEVGWFSDGGVPWMATLNFYSGSSGGPAAAARGGAAAAARWKRREEARRRRRRAAAAAARGAAAAAARERVRREVGARERRRRRGVARSGRLSWAVLLLGLFGLVFPQDVFFQANGELLLPAPWHLVLELERLVNRALVGEAPASAPLAAGPAIA